MEKTFVDILKGQDHFGGGLDCVDKKCEMSYCIDSKSIIPNVLLIDLHYIVINL